MMRDDSVPSRTASPIAVRSENRAEGLESPQFFEPILDTVE